MTRVTLVQALDDAMVRRGPLDVEHRRFGLGTQEWPHRAGANRLPLRPPSSPHRRFRVDRPHTGSPSRQSAPSLVEAPPDRSPG